MSAPQVAPTSLEGRIRGCGWAVLVGVQDPALVREALALCERLLVIQPNERIAERLSEDWAPEPPEGLRFCAESVGAEDGTAPWFRYNDARLDGPQPPESLRPRYPNLTLLGQESRRQRPLTALVEEWWQGSGEPRGRGALLIDDRNPLPILAGGESLLGRLERLILWQHPSDGQPDNDAAQELGRRLASACLAPVPGVPLCWQRDAGLLLGRELDTARAQLAQLEEQQLQWEEQRRTLLLQREGLMASSQAWEVACQQARAQIADLERGRNELAQERDVLRVAHDLAVSQRDGLDYEHKLLTQQLETARQEGEALRQALESRRLESESQGLALERARAELKQAHGEREQLHGALEQAHRALEQVQGELGQARGELVELRHGEEQHRAERRQLADQLERLQRVRERDASLGRAMEQTIGELGAQRDELLAQREGLLADRSGLERERDGQQRIAADLETRNERLSEQNEQLRQRQAELERLTRDSEQQLALIRQLFVQISTARPPSA